MSVQLLKPSVPKIHLQQVQEMTISNLSNTY